MVLYLKLFGMISSWIGLQSIEPTLNIIVIKKMRCLIWEGGRARGGVERIKGGADYLAYTIHCYGQGYQLEIFKKITIEFEKI